jgi:hypothetical protein
MGCFGTPRVVIVNSGTNFHNLSEGKFFITPNVLSSGKIYPHHYRDASKGRMAERSMEDSTSPQHHDPEINPDDPLKSLNWNRI